jgi:hypothetical protein
MIDELVSKSEFQQVKSLLAEKKQLQLRLNEVNRQLRELDAEHPGISACARQDLDRKTASPPLQSTSLIFSV